MTKRRMMIPTDLENLAQANANFHAAYTAMQDVQARVASEEVEAEEMTATYAVFLQSAVHLYTTANTVIKVARADSYRPELIVPDKPTMELP